VFRTSDEVLNEGVDKMNGRVAAAAPMCASDRSMIFNSDLVETLELDNLLGQALVDRSPPPRTARKAAARMHAKTSPTATMRSG
jgi:succinate dehydrogenase / fumarate reductase, flavoprotein subunit